MQIIYGLTHPHEGNEVCIYCDTMYYKDEIKEEAMPMMAKWNAENPDDQLEEDMWDAFMDEAIEKAIENNPRIPSSCSSCK
jgi:hypothetical protein